jgi:15-cis-phytoene synthase
MAHEAARAEAYFQDASEELPAADRVALLPARIMDEIYHLLLEKMRGDRFRVFEKRYRVSQARKLAILSKHLIARSR